MSSKSAAQRWGEAREREWYAQLTNPQPVSASVKEVPTLAEFAPRFLEGHARANRHKPSGIAAQDSIVRVHLIPLLGPKKLDVITSEDVQSVKRALHARAPKTVNNVLTVLSVLGGEAGLRCGEMMALEWSDVDLGKRQLCVQRSDWKGHVTATKGGRVRYVPLTIRLATALREHRHLRGARVLGQRDGSPLTQKIVQEHVRRSVRRAQIAKSGVHRLRHTFCSHLAMRGAPARAIQELAGHMDLATTQRYMHLSPAAIEGAIRLLDQAKPVHGFGDIVETGEARQ